MAEYKDTREGLLVEYSEKILAECGIDPNSTTVQDKLHKHL